MSNKLTTIEFIKKANNIHNNKYGYSLVKYTKSCNKIKIVCPEHGVFEQIANMHLRSSGCYKCSYKNRNDSRKLNNTIFTKKANKTHNNKYDYSLVKYTEGYNKVKIICPEHGIFEQEANSHLRGSGCKLCGVKTRSEKRKYNTINFIKKGIVVHNNKYNYSLTKYTNIKTSLMIICPKHGVFEQNAGDHINNRAGCPKCKNEKLSLGVKKFIEKSVEIHKNKYDYSFVDYVNYNETVKIICPEHGIFEQTPHSHLKKHGCSKCGKLISKHENEIVEFIKNDLNIINIIRNNRKILNGKEIDIYLPDHKFAIEFNGLYYHSELFKPQNYHLDKTNLAELKGIKLIHIFEDEWVSKPDIVKSIIKSKLGLVTNKIYARKCTIKETLIGESRGFLNNNHIQGTCGSNIKLGLYHNNELVSLMTFIKSRKSISSVEGSFELNRFCNKINTSVVGGASKLLTYFNRNHNPNEIISYADRRYSKGDLYKKLGFNEIHTTKPNYSYFNNCEIKRYHRFGFRKDILGNNGFDVNKTAHKIMLERKYYRIYDCGKIKYKSNK